MTWLRKSFLILLSSILLMTACASRPLADAKSVFKTAKDSVFQIYIKSHSSEDLSFIGTGFVIDKPNCLVTARHVADYDSDNDPKTPEIFKIKVADKWYELLRMTSKTLNDVAFFKLPVPMKNSLKLEKNDPSVGESIFVVGNPSPDDEVYHNWLSVGIVNGYMEDKKGLNTGDDFYGDYMGISATLYGGYSGSPVLNNSGKVVGIAVAGYYPSIAPTIQFAVPISLVKEDIKNLQ